MTFLFVALSVETETSPIQKLVHANHFSIPEMKYVIWGNVHRGNARSTKCYSGNCPSGKFLRGTFHRGKVRRGKCPSGKFPRTESLIYVIIKLVFVFVFIICKRIQVFRRYNEPMKILFNCLKIFKNKEINTRLLSLQGLFHEA